MDVMTPQRQSPATSLSPSPDALADLGAQLLMQTPAAAPAPPAAVAPPFTVAQPVAVAQPAPADAPMLGAIASPLVNQKVAALAEQLANANLEQIHAFGREVGAHTSAHTDSILERVRGSDLDAMGAKLGQIVTAAQSMNLNALSDTRSRIPLLGPLIDRVRLKGGEFMRRFQDVRTQVDTLIDEVDTMQRGLSERNGALDASFESVRQEHDLLGLHVMAGAAAVGRLKTRIATPVAEPTDPFALQGRHDLQTALTALEKRIADMRVLQHAALQQLPMIRMVQANNRMLIEKFHTIKDLTVPAWKRQFMLALSLNEQKNAVQLATSIDDATNQFLLENARLLKDNTIATAKANQRLVIDVDTLRQVHDSLLATMQEVIQINRDGVQQRATISAQLQTMRTAMTQQFNARA